MTTKVNTKNGIDVDQLVETAKAIEQDPTLSSFTFRAKSTWQDGTYNTGEISSFRHAGQEDESRDTPFQLVGDEPPVVLGTNQGPNAVELLLVDTTCWPVDSPRLGIHNEFHLVHHEFSVPDAALSVAAWPVRTLSRRRSRRHQPRQRRPSRLRFRRRRRWVFDRRQSHDARAASQRRSQHHPAPARE